MDGNAKQTLRGVMINALGTVVGAGLIAILAFFAGKINLVVLYWKEIFFVLVFIFVFATFYVWFKKLLRLESEVEKLSANKTPTLSIDYGPDIKKLKDELVKKIDAVNSSVKRIDSDLIDLKRDHLYAKAEKHEAKGQRGALLCRLNVIEMDIKNDSFELDDSLEELYTYVKNESVFSTQDLSDAKEALSKIQGAGKKEIANHILEYIKGKLH
jgi:hypothetical protein